MSAITDIQITNPSAEHPLRISVQTRRQPQPAKDTLAPRVRRPDSQLTQEERAALEKRGSELVRVALDKLHDGKTVEWPRWQYDGAPSLAHWISLEFAKSLQPTQSDAKPKGFRLSEDWNEAHAYLTLAPSASTQLRLQDSTRYLLASKDHNAALSLTNPSVMHSLALRVLDKSGSPTGTQFVPPGGYGVLVLGQHGAALEQRPT